MKGIFSGKRGNQGLQIKKRVIKSTNKLQINFEITNKGVNPHQLQMGE